MLEVCGQCPQLTSVGISALVEALMKSTQISNLQFTNIPIQREGLEAISNLLLSSENLRTLGIINCAKLGRDNTDPTVTWKSFVSAAIGPKNTHLKTLDLSGNHLSPNHIHDLADTLKNDTVLENLILSENKVGDEGIQWLCQALKTNATLKVLSIASCQLSNQSLHYLLDALKHNTTLEQIYSYSNPFKDTKRSKEVDYWLEMNRNGRSDIRAESYRSEFIPNLVVKCSRDSLNCERPDRVYGILRELPHLWYPVAPSR
jgi:Ran GTPase-activating protein (RanGAP) involved in mRNA processing and transport